MTDLEQNLNFTSESEPAKQSRAPVPRQYVSSSNMNTLSTGHIQTDITKQDLVSNSTRESFTLTRTSSKLNPASFALVQRVFDDIYGNVSFRDLSPDTLSEIEKLSIDFLRLRKLHAFV